MVTMRENNKYKEPESKPRNSSQPAGNIEFSSRRLTSHSEEGDALFLEDQERVRVPPFSILQSDLHLSLSIANSLSQSHF